MHIDISSIGMQAIQTGWRNKRCVGHLVGVIHRARSPIRPEQRFAGNVANTGCEGHPNRPPFCIALDFLKIGETDHDQIAGLHIAEGQGEQIVPFHSYQRRPETFCFPFAKKPGGILSLLDFCNPRLPVHMELTPPNSSVAGQRKCVNAIQRLNIILMKNLVDLYGGDLAIDFRASLDPLERKDDSGFFQPRDQPECTRVFRISWRAEMVTETVFHLWCARCGEACRFAAAALG